MKPFILSFLLLTAVLKSADCQVPYADKLSDAALELTRQLVDYDPAYFTIAYPNGDIPAGKGVCTDVVIRAYRKLGLICKRKFMKI